VIPTTSTFSDNATRPFLPAETLDGITDFLARASDPGSRAALVSALVFEIYDTAAWLADSPGSRELDSMGQILAEARAHQARMIASKTCPAPSGAYFDDVAAAAAVPA
jgi:hypothetical protein